jgi:hypothetical protein
MSKGPGRIEREIAKAFDAAFADDPNIANALTVEELCYRVQDGADDWIFTGPHRRDRRRKRPIKVREMDQAEKDHAAWTRWKGTAQVEKKHRVSVIRAAKRIAKKRGDVQWLNEWERGSQLIFFSCYNLTSIGMAHQKAIYGRWRTESEMRARIAPGGEDHKKMVPPDGVYCRDLERYIAERDGDTAALERLETERQQFLSGIADNIKGLLGGKPKVLCSFCGKNEDGHSHRRPCRHLQ